MSRQTTHEPSYETVAALAHHAPAPVPFRFMGLPAEIQLAILEFAVLKPLKRTTYPSLSSTYDSPTLLAISITSRALRSLTIQLQYRTIILPSIFAAVPSHPGVTLLARTLQENPALGAHCQHICVSIRDGHTRSDARTEYDALRQITDNVPDVRALDIQGGFCNALTDSTCEWLRGCVAGMKSLDRLYIRTDTSGISIMQLLHNLQSQSLRRLVILCAFGGGHRSFLKLQDSDPFYQKELSEPHLTDLTVGSCFADSRDMRRLLNWPWGLEKFTMGAVLGDTIQPHMVVRMLLKHRQWLRTLSIGHFHDLDMSTSSSPEKAIDLTGFSALEELTLTRSPQWSPVWTEKHAEGILMAPKLRQFMWVLLVEKEPSKEWGKEAAEAATRWLRTLAAGAVARNGTLANIHVHLGIMVSMRDGIEEGRDSLNSLVEVLCELRDEFALQGIRITHSDGRPPPQSPDNLIL